MLIKYISLNIDDILLLKCFTRLFLKCPVTFYTSFPENLIFNINSVYY